MPKNLNMRRVVTWMALAQLAAFASAQTSLDAGFRNPPTSAKPMTWWHWINGNISKSGITKDLEAMKRFGLSGAQIFNVEVGIPVGDKPFMTAAWKDALGWAFKEAKRLGLTLDVHNCAGWSSSGGPWVKPEFAMQNLTWSERKVQGPGRVEAVLAKPPARLGYYRDVACFAVRTPANDAFRIENIRAKAAFERGDRLEPNDLAPRDAATDLKDVRVVAMDANGKVAVDLPEGNWTLIRMGHTPTGAVNAPAPTAGRGPEVDKLSREALDQFWTGMMATAIDRNGPITKSGLIGALIDSYEVGSQNWTPKFREEFQKRRGYDPMPYLVCVTGRVVNSGEATERFLWDLRRTVCDLFAENYFGYFAELCHKNGLRFAMEGYGNGSFDNLQVNGAADLPMAEFWIGNMAIETAKMVAASAHTHGKPVIGAEAFTADDTRAKWLYDPYAIKSLGDRMFAFGINKYIFHRYAHQPWVDLEPGMTMGPWGTNFDRTITWWDPGRAWIEYVSRCQFLLQSGQFVADVLVFEGDDGPNDLPLMRGSAVPDGFDYDGCDAQVLLQAKVENGEIVLPSGMRYRLLMLPNSTRITVRTMRKIDELVRAGVVLLGAPPTKSPSLAEMGDGDRTVTQLAQRLWGGDSGKGKVFANAKVGDVLRSLGVANDVESKRPLNWIHRRVGSDDVYFIANPNYKPIDVDVTFRVDGKQPEIWNPETGSTDNAVVWRSEGGRTTVPLRLESAGSCFVVFRHPAPSNYFTSATWSGPAETVAPEPKIVIFSAKYEATDGAGSADVTDKVRALVESGEMNIAATNANFGDPFVNHLKRLHIEYSINDKRTTANIPENGSLDFVPPGADDARPKFTVSNGRAYLWGQGSLDLASPTGKTHIDATPIDETPLTSVWTLTFPPKKGAPPSTTMDKLTSWTESTIDGVRYFSGTATYKTSFDYTITRKGPASYWLDLGRVKNFAEVTLNGQVLPTLWKAPFRIDVSPWLRSGRNTLEVKVTNLWPNRLIGDERYPPEAKFNGPIQAWPDWIKNGTPRPPTERVTFTTWQFFQKDSPLLESGLLGPVKILRVPTVTLRP